MAANTGFPKPECLPYFYITATTGALPDYLGYIDSSSLTADAVWTLPEYSTPSRQMVVGTQAIFKNISDYDLTIITVGEDTFVGGGTEFDIGSGYTVMLVLSPTGYNVFGVQFPGFRGASSPIPDSIRVNSRQAYLRARAAKPVTVTSATPQ